MAIALNSRAIPLRMIENNADNPTSEDLMIATFERMPTAKKMELFADFIYALNEDFSKLNDPVLTREMDVLDGIYSNIESRLEEIAAIYGLEGTNSNLLRLTEAGISVYIAPKLPDGLDPDEFLVREGMEGWKAHIDAAKHGFRWKAQRLAEAGDVSTDKGKAEVLRSAIAFCKAVKNHSDLDVFFWPVIRSSLGMEPEEFRAQLEKLWESSPVAAAEFGGGSGGDGGDGDGGDRTGKVVKHPSFSPISPYELEARLNALVQEGLTGSKLTNRLNQLAEETGRHIIELRKQYSERLAEVEQAELREDTAHQVEVLLEASTASLDLRKILPANLATPLLKLAGWLNLKPEAYLTTLLTTVSILHKAGTIVVLNKEWDFEVSPNMFATIISPSSQKKSPILKAICKKPLGILQREAHEEYKNQMKAYGEELKEWEATKPEDREEPPVKPERKIYFFTKTTGEGLTYQAARCPEQGILCLSDELAGMLGAQNQYRGGKGSDKQDWLTYYDGMGDTTLRAEGIKAESDFVLLGIIGGIQPKIMQKLLDDCSDSDGGWARFLFVNQPNAASQMSVDGGSYDLTDLLADLYRRIDALPVTTYRLSPEAFRLFCKAYNRLEEKRVSERLEGMQAVWGKSEGRIGKLAVNLHVIHALMKGQTPSEEIPVEFIQAAITLTKYYAQQVQSLYTQFSDPDALAPHLANVIQLAQRKGGWIKASDVYLSITKKHRPSGSTVREWFSELVLMGKGEVKGEGRSLQFRVFSDKHPPTPPACDPSSEKLDDFRQELDKSSNAESTIYQDTQELLDKLDDLDNFPKHIMDVEALEVKVDLTTGMEKTSLLDESSNLSNFVQDVQPETETALDKSSNESSNLDALDTEEAIAPTNPVEIEPEATEIEADEQIPQLLQQGTVETAPTELEEEYTVINADADGWGEIVRKEEAIAPTPAHVDTAEGENPVTPVKIASEATELLTVVETPQTIAAKPVEEAIAPLAPVETSFDEEVAALVGVLANEVICPNRDELSLIRQLYSPATLKAACKQLSPERHAQIRQWVIELNEAIAPVVPIENAPEALVDETPQTITAKPVEEAIAVTPDSEPKSPILPTPSSSEILTSGEAVGRMVHTRNIKGEISREASENHKVV